MAAVDVELRTVTRGGRRIIQAQADMLPIYQDWLMIVFWHA